MVKIKTPLSLACALVLAVAGCDASGPAITRFDPSTIDYDTVSTVDYDRDVRPLLEARNVFGATGSARTAGYAYAALFESAWGETIIPFDGASPLLRLATDSLAPGIAHPYPNLTDLEPDEVRFLTRWIEGGARGPAGVPAYADARNLLYVCNQLDGRVAIVDTDRMRTIRTVAFEALGQPADARPHHVVAEPDGSAWYVALIAGGDGEGAVLRLSGSLALDPADPGYLLASSTASGTFETPGMLALAAGRLYAGRSFSAASTSNGVAQFAPAEALALEAVTTPPFHPHAIGATPDGRFFLTAGLSSPNQILLYDAATQDVVATAPVPDGLAFVQFAVGPAGRRAVLTSQLSGELFELAIDPDAPAVSVTRRTPVGQQPWHPALSPDGRVAYVPNRISNSVSFVDLSTGAVTRTVDNASAGSIVFSQPHGAALSADGRTLFVSNRNRTMSGVALYQPPLRFRAPDGTPEPADRYANVVAIDTRTGAVLGVVPQGRWASGLATVRRPSASRLSLP